MTVSAKDTHIRCMSHRWRSGPQGFVALCERRTHRLALSKTHPHTHLDEGVHYEATPRDHLNDEMRMFLEWFNHPPPNLDTLLRAGLVHAWFEIVHPFEDGNRRVGRALLDMALAQDEPRSTDLYSMSARFMEKRDEYFTSLDAHQGGDLDVTHK
jgi:Fic family protein